MQKKSKAKIVWMAVVFLLGSGLGYWANELYQGYRNTQDEVCSAVGEEYGLSQKLNKAVINRGFLGCEFGDAYEDVKDTLAQQISGTCIFYGKDATTIKITDIKYGSKEYESMTFSFYKSKLYQVQLDKSYASENEKLKGFMDFKEIFEKNRNYPRDVDYGKDPNCYCYSDGCTRLKLRKDVSIGFAGGSNRNNPQTKSQNNLVIPDKKGIENLHIALKELGLQADITVDDMMYMIETDEKFAKAVHSNMAKNYNNIGDADSFYGRLGLKFAKAVEEPETKRKYKSKVQLIYYDILSGWEEAGL